MVRVSIDVGSHWQHFCGLALTVTLNMLRMCSDCVSTCRWGQYRYQIPQRHLKGNGNMEGLGWKWLGTLPHRESELQHREGGPNGHFPFHNLFIHSEMNGAKNKVLLVVKYHYCTFAHFNLLNYFFQDNKHILPQSYLSSLPRQKALKHRFVCTFLFHHSPPPPRGHYDSVPWRHANSNTKNDFLYQQWDSIIPQHLFDSKSRLMCTEIGNISIKQHFKHFLI